MTTLILPDGTIEIKVTRSQAFQIQTAMRRLVKLNPGETPEGKRNNEIILSHLDEILNKYSRLVIFGRIKE